MSWCWTTETTPPLDKMVLIYSPALKWRGLDGRALAVQHSDHNGRKGVWTLDGICGPIFDSGKAHMLWCEIPMPELIGE